MLHFTAGNDYTAISHDFTYAPEANMTCYILDALNDSVTELSEDYFLQYVSHKASVIINEDNRIHVTILVITSILLMEHTHTHTHTHIHTHTHTQYIYITVLHYIYVLQSLM